MRINEKLQALLPRLMVRPASTAGARTKSSGTYRDSGPVRTPFCAVMLDLDHFKRVNDRYGHAAGDEVLYRFANVIRFRAALHGRVWPLGRGGVPDSDSQLRPGGCPCSAGARSRGHLQDTISRLSGRMNFSAGISEYRGGVDAATHISQADAAMYAAKRLGRNRVQVYGAEEERQFPGSAEAQGLPGRTELPVSSTMHSAGIRRAFCGFARMRRCMGRGLRGYWVFPAMKYTGFSARSRRVLRPYQVKAFPLRRKQQPAAVAVRPLRRAIITTMPINRPPLYKAEHDHAATHAGQNGRQPPDEPRIHAQPLPAPAFVHARLCVASDPGSCPSGPADTIRPPPGRRNTLPRLAIPLHLSSPHLTSLPIDCPLRIHGAPRMARQPSTESADTGFRITGPPAERSG